MARTTHERACETCGRSFTAPSAEVKRGRGRFCSLACSSRRPRAVKRPNAACEFCATSFYRAPSKLVPHRRRFCSKRCKTRYQWHHQGPPVNNYTDGRASYRDLALRVLPNACHRCGFAACVDILEAHHRDGNRSNNVPGNLEILCPTCHRLHHFLTKTGPWAERHGQPPT